MFVTELATKEEAEKLELPEGAEVYRVERLSMHQGAPFLAERCVLPVSKFPKLRPHVGYSLSSLAQHNSILVGHAVELVRPVAATAAEARDLDISVGTPLLALDRVVFSERGEPIEWRLASLPCGFWREAAAQDYACLRMRAGRSISVRAGVCEECHLERQTMR